METVTGKMMMANQSVLMVLQVKQASREVNDKFASRAKKAKYRRLLFRYHPHP